jgi:hypothetical protein
MLRSKLLRYLSIEEQSVTRTAVEPLPGCRPKPGPQHQDFSFFVASFPAIAAYVTYDKSRPAEIPCAENFSSFNLQR